MFDCTALFEWRINFQKLRQGGRYFPIWKTKSFKKGRTRSTSNLPIFRKFCQEQLYFVSVKRRSFYIAICERGLCRAVFPNWRLPQNGSEKSTTTHFKEKPQRNVKKYTHVPPGEKRYKEIHFRATASRILSSRHECQEIYLPKKAFYFKTSNIYKW